MRVLVGIVPATTIMFEMVALLVQMLENDWLEDTPKEALVPSILMGPDMVVPAVEILI